MRNGLTKTNGIHLVIEDREKSPSILSNGISVKPGAETNVGLKIATISRLRAPYASNCMTAYLQDGVDELDFLAEFDYSAKNCKSWCYIGTIIDFCNCFDHTMLEGIIVEQFLERKQAWNMSVCNKTAGSPQYDCVRNIMHAEDEAEESLTGSCSCGAECQETEYKVTIYH